MEGRTEQQPLADVDKLEDMWRCGGVQRRERPGGMRLGLEINAGIILT